MILIKSSHIFCVWVWDKLPDPKFPNGIKLTLKQRGHLLLKPTLGFLPLKFLLFLVYTSVEGNNLELYTFGFESWPHIYCAPMDKLCSLLQVSVSYSPKWGKQKDTMDTKGVYLLVFVAISFSKEINPKWSLMVDWYLSIQQHTMKYISCLGKIRWK